MSSVTARPLNKQTESIICDEEGTLDPVSWRGTTKTLGADYNEILKHCDNGLLYVNEQAGVIEIRGRDRVGTLYLPSGRKVYIRTKVPGLVLIQWLTYLGEFPELRNWNDDGNVTFGGSYHSVLADLFLQELQVLTRCYMRKGFIHCDVESSEVRGRILNNRLAQQPWRLPAIPQRVRQRSINTPPNQMLAAALDQSMLLAGKVNHQQFGTFQQLLHSWSEISRSPEDLQYIIQSSIAAPPDGYRVALQLARLILRGATFDPCPGTGSDSFTLPLAIIWEQAVNKMCQELTELTGWQVAPRNQSIRHWDDSGGPTASTRLMKADTLLEKGVHRWVLDAKYKCTFGQETRTDRFQMCAYALGFTARRSTLVYPIARTGVGTERLLLSTRKSNAPVEITSIALPMAAGVKQCKESLAKFLMEHDVVN